MKVAPLTRPLPTGNELMSGPIKEGGMTRQEKEIEFVMENIDGRLESLQKDEKYQTYKAILFFSCVFSAMIGVTLILFGFRQTFFFKKYSDKGIDIPAIVFGGLFCTPIFYWFYYVFIPSKEEKRKRRTIYRDRADRRKPTLFNQLVEEARKATEPPPRRIRVLAHIRKHDYPIVASTMHEFTEAIANQCGLTVERQLLRYNDVDMVIELDKKLDVHYGLDDNARIYVYNKGGFFTNSSPLKRARVDIMHMNDEIETISLPGGDTGNGRRPDSSASRVSISGNGNRPSYNQSTTTPNKNSKTSFNSGLKSALTDVESRDSMNGNNSIGGGNDKKKGNISWKK